MTTTAAARTRVTVDRRPLPVVLASRLKREIALAGLLAAFVLALRLPPPPDLDPAGWKALCIFGLSGILWLTGLIPMAITGLLVIASIPLLGILKESQAYAKFGTSVVFFILGALILAAALTASGLSTRLTLLSLRAFGATPRRLTLGVYLTSALFSCVMSEHAVAAMIFPIVVEIARVLGLQPRRSAFGRSLFFALAWGCVIGGMTTILGGGRGPLAIGMLEEFTRGEATITFSQYVLYGVPLVVTLLAVGALLNLWLNPPEITTVAPARDALAERIRRMGPTSTREILVGAVMTATIAAWMFVGPTLGLANIAILAIGLLFAVRAVTWSELEAGVNWSILLMYGGAICLGAALADSGAARWLAERVTGGASGSPVWFLLAIAALTAALTEVMSNAAVVAVVLPAALGLGAVQGLDPRVTTMVIVLASSFNFMLPMGTPAAAIAFSAGYYRPLHAVRAGVVLSLASLACMLALLVAWWPLVGLR